MKQKMETVSHVTFGSKRPGNGKDGGVNSRSWLSNIGGDNINTEETYMNTMSAMSDSLE